jgi:asparagine N-glycosylation enzyme membrane subunit Stt3
MTQQEIEDELKSLREREQARQKNWRSIRRSAVFCATVFLMGGFGFLAFSIAYPGARHEAVLLALIFIVLSLPMSLLRSALRD